MSKSSVVETAALMVGRRQLVAITNLVASSMSRAGLCSENLTQQWSMAEDGAKNGLDDRSSSSKGWPQWQSWPRPSTKGVATGTRMGPSYACLFVGYVEQSLFQSYTGP
eukprot:g39972.t1